MIPFTTEQSVITTGKPHCRVKVSKDLASLKDNLIHRNNRNRHIEMCRCGHFMFDFMRNYYGCEQILWPKIHPSQKGLSKAFSYIQEPWLPYFFTKSRYSWGGWVDEPTSLNNTPKDGISPSLKLTAKAPGNGPKRPKRKQSYEPSIHFQVRFDVSFRECKFFRKGPLYPSILSLSFTRLMADLDGQKFSVFFWNEITGPRKISQQKLRKNTDFLVKGTGFWFANLFVLCIPAMPGFVFFLFLEISLYPKQTREIVVNMSFFQQYF